MSIKKNIRICFKYLVNKDYRFAINRRSGRYNNWDDEKYLKKLFKAYMGYELDLENPKTFNEKLQWLKLYNRKPEYTTMVDKYKAREYVASLIGEEYLIPLLGVYDSPEEIDFDKLPDQFVLKCNHNSGLGVCICKDKSKLNIDKVKKKLQIGLNQDYYLSGREWPYKDVERKIICEKYMTDSRTLNNGLTDYKLMCFNGKVKCIFTCTDRFSKDGLKVTFFDTNWEKLPFERHYKSADSVERPKNLKQMICFAEKLALNVPFLRVDFYEVNNKIYFGELTFFPGCGFEEFSSIDWDLKLGDMIKLPTKDEQNEN